MKWEEFVKLINNLSVVNTEFLLAGAVDPKIVRVQISRWCKAGKIIQIKRGIYVLADVYRKVDIYEPYIAAVLEKPSYISLEKALEFHNLIPEAVLVYTSVTPKKTAKFVSEIGVFEYRHIKSSLFWGYESLILNKQTAFIASPEKALLDLIYIKRIRISLDYLNELRLQNVEKIDMNKLLNYAQKFNRPRMLTAARIIKKYIDSFKRDEKIL